ncbi:hypothetical protein L3X38_033598 [Prunus dulcis]|uniref:Uncharacterized protein n=1 Tax=Prunus dulcis TaxID=3755 RepID=A0AAD4VG85_PRUDU|nr:hypothetical protein L3X38_033598 [Prunus dulcis]
MVWGPPMGCGCGVVVVVAHTGDIRGLWDPYLLDGPYISVGPTLGEFFCTSVCSLSLLNLFVSSFEACFD